MKKIYKTKRTLLSLSDKKKPLNLKIPGVIQKSYWGVIADGRYSFGLKIFSGFSLVVSLVVAIAYHAVFSNFVVSIGVIIPAFFIPYVMIACGNLINDRLNYVNEQRSFVDVLESELTATNSTLEAIKSTSKHSLPQYLKDIMQEIVKRGQLGDSLGEIIDDIEKQLPSNDLRMAFAIIRINHKIGSSETINGLKEISKNLETRGDYVLLLKEKMSSPIIEKNIFFIVSIFTPLLMEMYQNGYFSSLMIHSWGPLFLVFIFFLSFGGQILMERSIQKTLEEL